MNEDDVALGREIAAARVRAGLTQADAALRIGIARSALANYEKGARSPTWGTLKQIARALGTQGWRLTRGAEDVVDGDQREE